MYAMAVTADKYFRKLNSLRAAGGMERRGGVAGNKSPFKNYAGAQIRKENFNGNKEDSGKEDREKTDPEDNAGVE